MHCRTSSMERTGWPNHLFVEDQVDVHGTGVIRLHFLGYGANANVDKRFPSDPVHESRIAMSGLTGVLAFCKFFSFVFHVRLRSNLA